jgi:predicted SAM-dependent methyltransferase
VIGNHILEHIPADQQAMKEIFRVLKPGGRAILQVPYSELRDSTIEEVTIKDPVKQSMLFGQKDHVRIYALSDYVHRLEQAGFEVEVLPYEALQKYYSLAIQPGEAFLKIQKPVTS